MATLTEQKVWTYTDCLSEFEEGENCEIIEGELFMVPSPTLEHQEISRDIEFFLLNYVRKNKLGKVFDAPIDVILDENNTVQPDLVFVAEKNFSILQHKGIFGAPDLVMEIVSPSSLYRDNYEKKELYEKFGVKEYWIVDPQNRAIEIFALTDGKYHLFCFTAEEGIAKSKLIQGFELDLSEIMPERNWELK